MTLTPIDPGQALNQNQRVTYPEPPPVRCEGCGKIVARQDQAINIILTVGSPGHPELSPFQCPGGGQSFGDHWACSIECWQRIAHACIDEHMLKMLAHVHTQKPESIHHEEAKGILS